MPTKAPVIELWPGVAEHAFASMMAELVKTNMEDHPAKRRDFAAMRGRVALVAEDADSTVTLDFRGDKMVVHAGSYGIPDLVVRGSSEALIDMSRVPTLPRVPFLPDPRSDAAKSLFRAVRSGKLKVTGALEHPGLAVRLSRVLSIY